MKYLLDTHTFLWLDIQPGKLSPAAKAALSQPDAERYLSVVSVWEIVIKLAIGKLAMKNPLPVVLNEQRQKNALQILPVALEHVLAVEGLAPHHNDPFDRLLIAQALSEGMSLVSADPALSAYPTPVVW